MYLTTLMPSIVMLSFLLLTVPQKRSRKRAELLLDLQEREYDRCDKNEKKNDVSEGQDDSMSHAEVAKGYEYLTHIWVWSLTFEEAEALRAQLAGKTQEIKILEATSPSQICRWE
jgi:hypothetical protein